MITALTGRSLRAALLVCAAIWPGLTAAQTFTAMPQGAAAPLGHLPFAPGQEICLRWQHSVTGGAVADCFENHAGQLTLTRSYLHDFAAGLGELAGRGTISPAPEGGYWITGMAEPIPGNELRLRVGASAVNHRLTSADGALALSQLAAGRLVLLRLLPN